MTKKKIPRNIKTPKPLDKARERHEKTLKRLHLLERRLPWLAKFTRHPKYKSWAPPLFATAEVGLPLFFVFVILPFIISLLPTVVLPDIRIPWPKIDLPTIPLPDINLPTWNLPDLPAWLDTLLYWLRKTTPIWIALGFAVYASRKHDKKPVKK